MSALMGPPTMETWPEGVMLGIGMGFSFTPQQPVPLQLMVRSRQHLTGLYLQFPQEFSHEAPVPPICMPSCHFLQMRDICWEYNKSAACACRCRKPHLRHSIS